MPRSREGYLWTPQGAIEGLETDAVLSSTPNVKSSYQVIVIGAGFAGLIAARDLSRHYGLDVLVVEGRDRIGGRTWTASVLDEQLEMGGTWVHWNQPHVYTELQRYGLHRNLKTSAGTFAAEKTYYKKKGADVVAVDTAELYANAEAVAVNFFQIDGKNSRDLMPYPHDPFRDPVPWKAYDHLTVRQRLDQMITVPENDKDVFETLMNSISSAPGDQTGFTEALRWYSLGGHSLAGTFECAGVYKIGKGGMTSLARAILQDSKCDILFGTVISEINQDESGTMLTTSTGKKLQARAVVSTIPLNCLNDIMFDPPLSPLRQEAVRHGHINKGAKIHFKLRETTPGWFAICKGDGESPFCFAFSDHNGTSSSSPDGTFCIGFGYNDQLGDKRAGEHIIQEFKKNIKPDAEVVGYATHDWMNDPLAKGVWSSWGSHSMSKYLEELQQRHGRVVFASADWANGWRGFVDGAIERGIKAARDVYTLLAP